MSIIVGLFLKMKGWFQNLSFGIVCQSRDRVCFSTLVPQTHFKESKVFFGESLFNETHLHMPNVNNEIRNTTAHRAPRSQAAISNLPVAVYSLISTMIILFQRNIFFGTRFFPSQAPSPKHIYIRYLVQTNLSVTPTEN